MAEVQRQAREMLDEYSSRYGLRGLSFQLKQGVHNNGAGTNLWVEALVLPIIHVQAPVPVPVPALCPVILRTDARPVAAETSSDASPTQEAPSGRLNPQQVEYLRMLQENQLLRQQLQQCRSLIEVLIRERVEPVGDGLTSGGVRSQEGGTSHVAHSSRGAASARAVWEPGEGTS